MAAAKAKLHSLLSKVGSLGYSLVPPGDQVKRRVYGVQQKAHTPKFRNPWRKKKKKTSAMLDCSPFVFIHDKIIIH